MKRNETDEELYVRIVNAYGRWGAFLGHAMECRGERLDECAAHVGVKREAIEERLAQEQVRPYQTQNGEIEHVRDSDKSKFARALLDAEAELKRLRPVYEAARTWRWAVSDYEGECLSNLCAAVDAADPKERTE